jgi:hypothetical protein
MNLDPILESIRAEQPDTAEVERAAARVKGRLFPKSEGVADASGAAPVSGAIRSCADFQSLFPAYLAGTLDAPRKLLLEVHVRECVACRAALADARHGARNVIEFAPRPKSTRRYVPIAIAASVSLAATLAGWWGYTRFPALAGGPRATVASVDGGLFRVAGDSLTPLSPGAELGENEAVRAAKNSNAVLRLNDGSRIELNQRAEISVTRDWKGSTVHLAFGNIIVEAAKQRAGALRVLTADCDVAVKGTVFSVNAGTKGSRVAVVEGTVWVDHGSTHEVLHRGDIASTTPGMEPVPIRTEFEWSRNSSQYLSLLGDFGDINRRIGALPSPALRHETALMSYLPADITAVAAIPNIGGTLAEARTIFYDKLSQHGPLAQWWMGLPARQRDDFETTVTRLETASAYLGSEIVVAAAPSPVILAQTVKPGLDTYLKSQLPPALYDGHTRFENGLFVAAEDSRDLDRISTTGTFTQSSLYRQLAPSYRKGAGWLFGADLAKVPNVPIPNARFLVAESRTVGNQTENRASVVFSREREGVASWLAAPGPMGTLDFVSPDAGFAISMLLKNPSLIVKDMSGFVPGAASSDPAATLTADIAGALGGEITLALDGPLFPVPSWKVAAEIYYPERFQSAISRFVASVNEKVDRERTGELKLTEQNVDGRTFYHLQFEKLPWGAEWTFYDGYWIAAANRELLIRGIQNRDTGYTLTRSKQFRDQLPHDASPDFSAVLYHSLGQTLAPLNALLGSTNLNAPKLDDAPGAICFWAAPDRIDVATMGNVFGMKIESLLAMQGNSPLQMMRGMLGQAGSNFHGMKQPQALPRAR